MPYPETFVAPMHADLSGESPFYTVPAQRQITVKDLLTHVSVLGSGPMGNSDIAKVARKVAGHDASCVRIHPAG